MKSYRTSLMLDILGPMLVGLSLVYVLDFLMNPNSELGEALGYSNVDVLGESYGIGGLPWAPSYVGKREYFSALSTPKKSMLKSFPKEDIALLSSMTANYEMYQPDSALFPTWIITPPNVSTIHRFFDSSPFSPSGRFLGLTRIPNLFKNSDDSSHSNDLPTGGEAEVVVIDLLKGTERVVFRTRAWGAQLGAQVQWGDKDTDLFFNIAGDVLKHGKLERSRDFKFMQSGLAGMVMNPRSGHKKLLDCPVYHVSQDGKLTVSPQLFKIHYTQMGYGADYVGSSGGSPSLAQTEQDLRGYGPNTGASKDDGVYVGNVETGKCELIASLHDLAILAGINSEHTPVYGFHTKFSSDGKLILFVLRSLEPHGGLAGVLSNSGLGLEETLSIPRVRRQHLFVLHTDGSSPMHLLSWASEPYKESTNAATKPNRERMRQRKLSQARDETMDVFDANHPSWLPHSHKISINLRRNRRSGAGTGREDRGHSQRGWDLAVLNVDDVYHRVSAGGGAPLTSAVLEQLWADNVVYNRSSGHPVFHPAHNNRYLVLDAYAKETAWFQSSPLPAVSSSSSWSLPLSRGAETARAAIKSTRAAEGAPHENGHVRKGVVNARDREDSKYSTPLRLVDTHKSSRGDAWALRVPLFSEPGRGELRESDRSKISSKHQHAWRCDMHPTWDTTNYRWLAFNGRPDGGNRQVLVSYTGGDLSKFFD